MSAAGFAAVLLLRTTDVCGDPSKLPDRSTPKVFDLAIANGKLAGTSGTIKVNRGDALELRWSSDRPMSLHLHGYDIESTVTPQSPVVMSFKADLAGRFPVSEHRHDAGRERPILYLEVYP